jgi:hypothetical protein
MDEITRNKIRQVMEAIDMYVPEVLDMERCNLQEFLHEDIVYSNDLDCLAYNSGKIAELNRALATAEDFMAKQKEVDLENKDQAIIIKIHPWFVPTDTKEAGGLPTGSTKPLNTDEVFKFRKGKMN